MSGFSITRSIGIDMGHRVPTHGSKCWNWHGHRYTINATCRSTGLRDTGVQSDMVLDFGFLKALMMDTIDALCDHGTCIWCDDPMLHRVIPDSETRTIACNNAHTKRYYLVKEDRSAMQTKVLVVPFIPTAERLAQFYFWLMAKEVERLSEGLAVLKEVEVWETPNCRACFPVYGDG